MKLMHFLIYEIDAFSSMHQNNFIEGWKLLAALAEMLFTFKLLCAIEM